MTHGSSQGAPASPSATGRVPWILMAVMASLMLGLNLVEWAWDDGQPKWSSILGWAGVLLLTLSILPQRPTLYHMLGGLLGLASAVGGLLLHFWR